MLIHLNEIRLYCCIAYYDKIRNKTGRPGVMVWYYARCVHSIPGKNKSYGNDDYVWLAFLRRDKYELPQSSFIHRVVSSSCTQQKQAEAEWTYMQLLASQYTSTFPSSTIRKWFNAVIESLLKMSLLFVTAYSVILKYFLQNTDLPCLGAGRFKINQFTF